VTEIVATKNLSKYYNPSTRALNNINLKIYPGEWITILGPSGSGKSTLLNMIGCLDKPTSGEITIMGVRVTQLSAQSLTRFRCQNIGLIFQQQYLIPYLTALENVMIAQYYHSVVDEVQAREALELVGLGHRLHHRPAHLSGGEQQRVCIARALINDPKIILADEPTGNLDQENARNIYGILKSLHNESQHTIILVTHDERAAQLGDRIIRLLDGSIISDQSVRS
jgi:putative ABC transport system ATP-binding protein